jgi:hypothetical protein
MIQEGTGVAPAGFLYVAWHPERPGFTKIGYTYWHPREPCWKYPRPKKRLHDIENYLEAFGFGRLRDWCSDFHPQAKGIEQRVRARLRHVQRADVGRNDEIYDVDPQELIDLIRAEMNA